MNKTLLATALLSSLTFSSSTWAAAFQLSETSVSGLGRAYAGEAAIADNASVVATNPALMTKFDRPMISVGAVFFDPNINVKGKIHATQKNVSADNVAPNELVPQMYAVYPINDRFALGAGVNVNYGLSTKYNEHFPAGFLGGETHLQAINTNFSGAYRYNQWSFGLGANVVYAQAKLSRHVGDLPQILGEALKGGMGKAKLPQIPGMAQTIAGVKELLNLKPYATLALVEGDAFGVGFNVGVAYEFSEDHRIAFTYHSPISLDFKGDYSNGLPTINTAIGQALKPILAQKGIVLTGGEKIPGKLKLTLPDYAQIAWTNRLSDQWSISYGMKWTNWSKFKELEAFNGKDGSPLFHKNEGFKDSWRYALGLTYELNNQWTLRTGVAYDTSAADAYHTISIPDTDRIFATLGATYRMTKDLSIDAGYAYVYGKKANFTEDKGQPTAATFESKASAMLYGLNVNYQF